MKFAVFLSILLISGCSSKPADAPAAGSDAAAPAASHATPAPASTAADGRVETIQGKVLEAIDGGSYTYVRVRSDRGDIWAATLKFPVSVGETVIVPLENPMRGFKSPTMKREFDLVYFASQISKPGETASTAAAAPAALPPGHPATSSASPNAAPPTEPAAKLIEPIAAAPGGISIASVWADRKTLSGKLVTVRGKIVKYNPGIMGLNWLHVQDGSGAVADGTHDLTITTTNDAKAGDIVTITGTVVVDKNFGAGYGYAVMLQGARVAR
jgi:hypothetical protein